VELRPLDASHDSLLISLQRQEDVWENIGTLPVSARDRSNHVFAVTEGPAALGFAGLVKSRAAGADDFELLCAMRSEVQQRGVARQACQLVLDWAFETAKLERVIASIDRSNHPARTIADKIGMTELEGVEAKPSTRIIYVKYRDKR
jgi:RimJ/RimL family protein N-acetyltransferase